MNSKPLVLIVEDEATIGNFITAIMESNGYAIIRSNKGKEAIISTASYAPDIILLDLGLPDIDGMEVLREIRSWSTVPIIVISARTNEKEKVDALDHGADDYVTKPFGSSELLARVRTALRHVQKEKGNLAESSVFTFGELHIDMSKHLVTLSNNYLHLTPIEYNLLTILARNAGKVVTIDYLSKKVWGPYTTEANALRVNMANIRRKIEKDPTLPIYILTEIGIGYRMVDEY